MTILVYVTHSIIGYQFNFNYCTCFSALKVLRNLVGTASSTSLMAATVYASEVVDKEKEAKNLIRPRDLSIYSKVEKQSK